MKSLLDFLGQVFLAVVLIAVFGAILARVASAAFQPASRRPARGAGGGTALRAPPAPRAVRGVGRAVGSAIAHPGNRQIRAQARADVKRLWEGVRSANWLEEQRHRREHGPAIEPGGGTTTTVKPPLRQRLRLRPFAPQPAPPENGGGNGAHPPVTTGQPGAPQAPPAPEGPPGTPHAPPSPAVPPADPTGGKPVPTGTSTVPADQLVEAINAIYAHAASGGITAKQEAIRAAHESAVRFAGMMQMLARTMSEPGSNYGPEVTEPIARAGQHFQAGAMSLSEADSNLETLANMTLREASTSPRQVPHHRNELSESSNGGVSSYGAGNWMPRFTGAEK